MASFLCFICHNTVNSDTNEDMRDKYREVVGMNLCPDSHLCYICHHMLNKLWLFKSICLKRSLEYPVLFSEKGTLNLQRMDIETIIICSDETCLPINATQLYVDNRDQSINSNDYFKLEDERHDFDQYFPENTATESVKTHPEIVETENENNIKDSVADFGNNCKDFDINHVGFVNNDRQFELNDNSVERHVKREENMLDFDLSKDRGGNESVIKESTELTENDVENYDSYDEERNECLNEIRNEEDSGELETSEKKRKSKKSKARDFEKIVLSFEEQKSELEAQRKSKKYVEAEFKCYNCALGFLFKDTYQTHMMRHEESNGEYVCVLCSLRFATGAVLRSHTALHSVRYRCSVCARYIRVRQTHTHARHCHGKACAATCHLCGRVFQDASGLQQHLKRFHMTKKSNRTYSCSVCGKNYNNQAAVRTHMIKHIHRKFTCDQCPSTFSSPYTLTQHKKKHTAADTDRQHYCASCGITYSSRKSLLAHTRNSVNHQHTAYECPICNRACPNQRALNSHISTVHSSTKSFSCPTCDARYTSRKSLVRHIRTHTVAPQSKLAVCHICGNSFKGKSKLNRHLREVCEKDKLEEELSSYYEQHNVI